MGVATEEDIHTPLSQRKSSLIGGELGCARQFRHQTTRRVLNIGCLLDTHNSIIIKQWRVWLVPSRWLIQIKYH